MDFMFHFSQLSKIEKIQFYVENMIPLLNKRALFSDGTEEYRIPSEPMPGDKVKIRFRTARENVNSVELFYREVTKGENADVPFKKQVMMRESGDRLFDYYSAYIQAGENKIEYHFKVITRRKSCYYNKKGVMEENQVFYDFSIMPGYKTPDWAKGAVFYQIFTDRFCNGDLTNDVVDREYSYIGAGTTRITDWGKYPASMDVREFYGGDLEGVFKKLDYLQELGVEVIYFNPLFVSPSNHKYDIQDYDFIDPHFGKIVVDEGEPLGENDNDNSHASKYISRVTRKENLNESNRFFAELVKEIHDRGMKVILDGVFNHCGSFNKWLDRERIYEKQDGYAKGAYVDKNSPYHSFFKFQEDNWPYNGKYDGWWGYDTLPKLNYEESEKLYDYIMRIARKWVAPPYNVDGWRLDVAADLGHSNEFNHKFWKDFRKNVKDANPNAIILAEHYGDPADWLQGDEWDTVMNYDAFMEPISWFLTGVEKHSDEFRGEMIGQHQYFFDSMSHYMSRFNTQSLQVAMNELSNHDHSRFLTRTNRKVGRTGTLGPEMAEQNIDKAVFRQAVMIQMTWPGAPTIYYGDEAGLCGWTDPDNRRTYPWGREDRELIAYHKELIRIHKDYQVFRTGSIKFLGGANKYICYGRFNRKEKVVIALNSNFESLEVSIPVWELGLTEEDRVARLILSHKDGYNIEAVIYEINNGRLHLTLPPQSGVIVKNIYDF